MKNVNLIIKTRKYINKKVSNEYIQLELQDVFKLIKTFQQLNHK